MATRTDLDILAVELMEALQTLDEQEVNSKPWQIRSELVADEQMDACLQMGPRQLEFPPNMPDFESPGQ